MEVLRVHLFMHEDGHVAVQILLRYDNCFAKAEGGLTGVRDNGPLSVDECEVAFFD